MGKRKQTVRKNSNNIPHSFLWFVVSGLAYDLTTFAKVIGYPLKKLAHYLARHKRIGPFPTHAFIYVTLGLVIMGVSFAFEHAFRSMFWAMAVETGRAVGAAPIWDTISGLTKVRADVEDLI